MPDSLISRTFSKLGHRDRSDLRTIYADSPESAAPMFPEVPAPGDPLSPTLLASRWVSGDLRGEDMPGVAADLLEAGYDSRSLRRLAGEMQASNSEALEPLAGAVFSELGVNYPMSEREARLSRHGRSHVRLLPGNAIHGRKQIISKSQYGIGFPKRLNWSSSSPSTMK